MDYTFAHRRSLLFFPLGSLGLRSGKKNVILKFQSNIEACPIGLLGEPRSLRLFHGEVMSAVNDWLAIAFEMSPSNRAALAHQLLLSLEKDGFDDDSEAAWAAELEARLARIERGQFQANDWREAIARMRQSLARKSSP